MLVTEFVGMGGSGKSYLHRKYREKLGRYGIYSVFINRWMLEEAPPLIKGILLGWLIPVALVLFVDVIVPCVRCLVVNRIQARLAIYYLINLSILLLLRGVRVTITSDQLILQSVVSILASRYGNYSIVESQNLVKRLLPREVIPRKVYHVIAEHKICYERLKYREDSYRSRLLRSGTRGSYWIGFSQGIQQVVDYLISNNLSTVIKVYN